MERILLIGSGGAGKSTLAVALGRRLGLPVVHLDREFWRPGWVEPSDAEWDAEVARFCVAPAWVMDGNYGRTLAFRLEACDTVIFLDLPGWLCLLRSLRHFGRSRPDMRPGCRERIDGGFLKFLLWIWNYRKRSRPGVIAALNRVKGSKRVVVLRSPREVRGFADESSR